MDGKKIGHKLTICTASRIGQSQTTLCQCNCGADCEKCQRAQHRHILQRQTKKKKQSYQGIFSRENPCIGQITSGMRLKFHSRKRFHLIPMNSRECLRLRLHLYHFCHLSVSHRMWEYVCDSKLNSTQNALLHINFLIQSRSTAVQLYIRTYFRIHCMINVIIVSLPTSLPPSLSPSLVICIQLMNQSNAKPLLTESLCTKNSNHTYVSVLCFRSSLYFTFLNYI